jgi:hypothetical protein
MSAFPPPTSRPDDRGAQPERTVLAWIRTTLALAGAGLLCVRLAPSRVGAILGAVVACGAAGLLIGHVRRLRSRSSTGPLPAERRAPGDGGLLDPRLVLLTTVVTALVGVLGLAFAFG